MASKEEIEEQIYQLYVKLVQKQSIFSRDSDEYRLFDCMRSDLNHDRLLIEKLEKGPTERELYCWAVEDLHYRPRNSIVASQVLPDDVKREIFEMCENGGYGFVGGMLVSPKMMAMGGNGSDHRGLMPDLVRSKPHKSQKGYKISPFLEANVLEAISRLRALSGESALLAKMICPEVTKKKNDEKPLQSIYELGQGNTYNKFS